MVAHRTLCLVLLVLAQGCMGAEDQQLLGPDGSDEAPWTSCVPEMSDAIMAGNHDDACAGWEGELCGHRESEPGPTMVVTCLDGRLIRSEAEGTSRTVPADRCTAPNVTDAFGYGYDVRTSRDGCLDVATCGGRPSYDAVFEVCQAPRLEGLRPGAETLEPWTDCEAAVQAGNEGDPCRGDLICGGGRSLGPNTTGNDILVTCEQGVLRTYAFYIFPF